MFRTNDEVPEKLGDFVQMGMYGRGTKALKPIGDEDPDGVEVIVVLDIRPNRNMTQAKRFEDEDVRKV